MATRVVSKTINLDTPIENVSKYIANIDENGILVHPDGDRDNGIKITDKVDIMRGSGGSSTSVAEFGTSARIGKIGESHLEMDYHSMRLIDKDTNQYFFVSDLRDSDGNITETFTGDGTTKSFTVGATVINAGTVKVDGVTKSYSRSGQTFTLSSAPAYGSEITIKYTPQTSNIYKMYTFGIRASNDGRGFMSVVEGSSTANGQWSHAEGYMTSAYGSMSHVEGFLTKGGDYAHAEGSNSTASGRFSHAQNVKTIAQRKSQTAIGEYNIADTSGADETVRGEHVLIIGNGTADNARSNALTVDWDGIVNCKDVVASNLVGEIKMYAGTTIPTGWLVCNGEEKLIADYPLLFNAIGTTWGTPSDSDHFKLPDLRGRAPIGVGTGTATGATAHALASMGGKETHTLSTVEMPSHGHNVKTWVNAGTLGAAKYYTNYGRTLSNTPNGNQLANGTWKSSSFNCAQSGQGDGTGITDMQGGGSAHTIMQPFATVNFIICAV